MNRVCPKHGTIRHYKRQGGGYRCYKCSGDAVTKRRRKVKEILVKEHGGSCKNCGYNKSLRALEFHHLDPNSKEFGIAAKGVSRSLDRARKEAEKCILLCSNCHMEQEDLMINIPG